MRYSQLLVIKHLMRGSGMLVSVSTAVSNVLQQLTPNLQYSSEVDITTQYNKYCIVMMFFELNAIMFFVQSLSCNLLFKTNDFVSFIEVPLGQPAI